MSITMEARGQGGDRQASGVRKPAKANQNFSLRFLGHRSNIMGIRRLSVVR
jgi:hypothetical protein